MVNSKSNIYWPEETCGTSSNSQRTTKRSEKSVKPPVFIAPMGSKTSRNPKCNESQVKWKKQIGRALDISINANGDIWAVGATKKIAGGRGIYWWHKQK